MGGLECFVRCRHSFSTLARITALPAARRARPLLSQSTTSSDCALVRAIFGAERIEPRERLAHGEPASL